MTDSLFMTARLHASEEYRKAIHDAEQSEVTTVTDLSDYLERLRNKRR